MLVKDCEFTGDFEKEIVINRLICGLKLRKFREKLLSQDGTITLERAVTIARAFEMTQEQLMSMSAMSMLPTTIKESTVKQEVGFVNKQRKFDQPTISKKCYFCGGV